MKQNDDSFLDPITEYILNESKRTSRTVVTRQTKIDRATGQLASIEGRKKNDPLYIRMIKYRDLYYKYRELLHRKYSPRVRTKAKQ